MSNDTRQEGQVGLDSAADIQAPIGGQPVAMLYDLLATADWHRLEDAGYVWWQPVGHPFKHSPVCVQKPCEAIWKEGQMDPATVNLSMTGIPDLHFVRAYGAAAILAAAECEKLNEPPAPAQSDSQVGEALEPEKPTSQGDQKESPERP